MDNRMDSKLGELTTAADSRRDDSRAVHEGPLIVGDVACDPFAGVGKPEQLRHALAGAWSRRIDEEHRLVYLVEGDDIVILQARYHYG